MRSHVHRIFISTLKIAKYCIKNVENEENKIYSDFMNRLRYTYITAYKECWTNDDDDIRNLQ